MRLKQLTIVLAGAGLSACASTNDVLSGPPEEILHSKDPPALVARCFEWLDKTRLIERADGARVARIRNGYGGVVRAYSIYPEGTGTRIEIRLGSFGWAGKWKRCVGLEPMPAEVLQAKGTASE